VSNLDGEVFGPPEQPTLTEPLQRDPDDPGPAGEFYPDVQGPGLEDRGAGNLQPEQEQFYGDVQDLSTPMDEFLATRSEDLAKGYAQALADNDVVAANGYLQHQIANAKISQAEVERLGLPPESRTAWNAYPNTAVEVQRMLDVSVRYMEQADMVLEKHDWKGQLEDWFYQDVIEPYKERNKAQLMVPTEGMDPRQLLLAQAQLESLVMDPMLVADKRQMLAKIDADLKLVHPSMSVFNYGPTAKVAKWIAREASLGGGYIQSGDVEGVGFLGEVGGEVAATALAGVESVFEFPLQLVYGGMQLVGATPPTNYIEGPDGEIITNGGKVPNLTETWIAVSARLAGDDVARRLAEHGKLSMIEQSKLTMVQQMARGTAAVAGMGFGFGLPAGAAMAAGQRTAMSMMQNGLARLAASGSPRAARALQIASGTAGAAVANGLTEAVAFGRHESYWKAFQGGAAIAPILMVFGAAGKRMGNRADQAWERMLGRERMPKRLREAVEGGVEGLGFGVMGDIHAYQQFEGSLWDYLKDPTQQRWMIYATNVLGMGLFKGLRGKGPLDQGQQDLASIVQSRHMFRRVFARKVSAAEERRTEDYLREQKEGGPVEPTPEEAAQMRQGVPRGTPEQVEGREPIVAEGETEARIRETQVEGREPMPDDIRAIREKDKIWRTKEEAQRLTDWTIESERQRFEAFEPERGETRGEQVEGKEPDVADPKKAKEQVKGVLRGPEIMMELGPTFGEKMTEGERVRTEDISAARTKKAESQGRDPLEDISFAQRPPEQQEAILERRTAKERREVAESFEGPERRSGEPRRAPEQPEPELPDRRARSRARSIRAELQREGPTPENVARVRDLQERAKGAFLGKVSETYRKQQERLREAGEKATVEEITPELRQQRRLYREAARQAGVDYDLVRELGEALRMVEDMTRPREQRAEALDRIRDLEEALDTQEALSDPGLNPKLLDELRERGLDALESSEMPAPEKGAVDPVSVQPIFGERYGPGSLRAGANPYRQQEELARDETMDRTLSEIFEIMEGRRGKPGFRIPFTAKRVGKTEGSPVQIKLLGGKVTMSGGTKGTLGVFKVFENLIRTKEDLDLMVGLHEWAHGMHRQVFTKAGGNEFWSGVQAQVRAIGDDARAEISRILEHYPGWEKLTRKQQMAEAWAEWHARNLVGDSSIRELYPELSRQIDKWLNAPEQRAFRDGQYRDLMVATRNWRDMGSRRRVGMTVRRAARKRKTYDKPSFISDATDAVVKAFFDDKVLLKKSQARWIERSDINAEDLSILMDPARQLDSIAMTAQKEAESFLLEGPHDIAWRRRKGIKSFKAIMDEVAGQESRKEMNARIIDFVDLVYSTRAIDKMDKGKIMPLPKSDYVQASKELLERNPEFQGKMEELKAWTDSLIDFLVEAAQISPIDAQRMKDNGVVYIPFVRIIRNSVSRFGGGRGVAEAGTGVKAFRGGSREELVDPVKAMEDVTRSMIVKARKAMVMRSLYQLMLHADVGGLATQVPKGKVANRYRLDQIMRNMKKELDREAFERDDEVLAEDMEEAFGVFAELLEANELSDTLVTLFGQKDLPFGEKEPIVAMVPRMTDAEINAIPTAAMRRQARENNGKMIWLQLDPAYFEALMGIDVPLSKFSLGEGLVEQVVSLPKEVLRTFATDANPAFVMANLMRDAVHASVFDREGKLVPFKGFAMLAHGGYLQLRYGSRMTPLIDKMIGEGNPEAREMWQRFQASGASTSSFFNEGLRRQLRGEIQSLSSRSRAVLDGWKRAMAAPESWIRLSAYSDTFKRAIKQGKPELEAGYLALEAAREVTVNFARGGDLARAYNRMTPYFTATMAGQRKMFRAFLGQEGRSDVERAAYQRRVWAQALANVTLPSIAAWMLVKDEDWFQDLPEWRKRNFINFKLPGTEHIMSLPLPFETGTIFGALPTAWLDDQTGGNPINISDAFMQSLFPYFEHTSSLIPAFIRPIAETATGMDFFRGRDLTPFWVEKTKPPAQQMRQSTTKTAQWMFEVFGKYIPSVDNPIELEQMFGGYTADFARTVMRATDEILSLKDHPGLSVNPFGRFIRQTPHGASRAVEDLYAEGKRIEQLETSDRTPAERSKLTRINRAKQEFSRVRRDLELGRLTKEQADERMFRTAHRIIGRSQ
jgi:hypothetical protein